MILFGALGLSSLTVSAAPSNADTQQTESLITDSSTRYISDVTPDANRSSVQKDSDYNDIRYQNSNNQKTDFQRNTSQKAATDNNTSDSSFDNTFNESAFSENTFNDSISNENAINESPLDNRPLEITAINESDNKGFVPADTIATTQNNSTAQLTETTAPKAAQKTGKVDVSDESIQDSLLRLAEFYELTPDTDASTLNNSDNANQDIIQNELTPTPQTIPKVGKNLQLLPDAVDSAQRCEGQWVYPKSNPNYQRAVNEAGATNGQPAPNLNGLPNNQAPLFQNQIMVITTMSTMQSCRAMSSSIRVPSR
ncbi:outer membrane protein Imp, required for envelope biogenesis [Psychrobacter sp. JCM 18902]|nr:outer membrane protein Imp, required for envelope biogenesis [Psychrobacter sp. JCM 18902]